QGLSGQIKNLTKAIFRTGLDIEDLVLSPLAAAEAVIGPKQKELGSALINIGASTTSLAVYEEGELLHTAVIPIGSEHITADIAIGLRCPIDLAEKIKLEFGDAVPSNYTEKDVCNIVSLLDDDNEDEIKDVQRKYLAEIIEARVEEIFEKVDIELKKIERSGMLPCGLFLVGGGTKLKGLVDVAKKQLRLPACLGKPKNIIAIIDKVNDTEYLNALGLVVWGGLIEETGGGKSNIPGKEVFGKIMQKVKKIFSSFLTKK
ncbi:cell division protein FtsA, partial [Candidatus Parcubacteria bacterium]|nr:cell division protein FtsA [Candidatus Parcubacteria bacterium]